MLLKCTFGGHSGNNSLGFVVTWWRLSPKGNKEELRQETTLQTSAFIELDGINLRLGDRVGNFIEQCVPWCINHEIGFTTEINKI